MEKLLERIRSHPSYRGQIVHTEDLPCQKPVCGEPGTALHPLIRKGLGLRGINALYSHQVEAVKEVRQGNSIVVVTPTASGKSMCYNIPVLDSLLTHANQTALYLFPTKSLSQD